MRLALYEPDIPQNTGTLLRMAACLSVPVDVIEPCGFVFDDRHLRRAAMDYLAHIEMRRHISWRAFHEVQGEGRTRLILLTSAASTPYPAFRFNRDDTLLVGRESAGVPQAVHDAADVRLRVPMAVGLRSLNVAVAAAMVLGHALCQTGGFPEAQ
jgi:tRNA (cytidine/uridine-2'-O-)-methyltransferase